MDPLLVAAVAAALAFAWTNGFHDAANAVATSLSTRALTPRVALAMAAVLNFVGAFLGQSLVGVVAGTVTPPVGATGLVLVLSALLGAIVWNLLTWWWGLPTSSTHALVGGLVGAALAASATVDTGTVVGEVLVPLVVSPLVALVGAWALMAVLLRVLRGVHPARANRSFRAAQTVSAAAMALGHGLQDAQKTMAVVVLALVAGGEAASGDPLPMWVVVASAAALAVGTYAGGWRLIRTLGRRIVDLDPARGFAAETVGASLLYVSAYVYDAPISTTQSITSAIVGAGVSRRVSAVRWAVVRRIVLAWVVTLPAAAAVAAAAYVLLEPVLA